MLLRRIKTHISDENWFAVFIDFVIVVVGVFMGIQVANWNEEQALYDRETEFLGELMAEAQNAIFLTEQRIHTYTQVTAAGQRSLDFLAKGQSCGTACWSILVDFMHASQWQDVGIPRSAYDNMRRLGLPRNRAIVEAVEAYLSQNRAATLAFSRLPEYRDTVRQLIPVDVQSYYWLHCFTVVDGIETYETECAKGVSDESALRTVEAIQRDSNLLPHLTQWTSSTILLPIALGSQNSTIERAIEAIDAELARR